MSHIQVDTSPNHRPSSPNVPDPEVVVKAERRHFSAEYKRRVLQEADACAQPGEVGALLRREGLYSSHLTTWRQQRRRGELQGLTPAKRGRKADPQAAEIARLQRENERLKAQLARAELIIDVQKKLSQMLGLPETPSDEVK
jgi:transposase-like protein